MQALVVTLRTFWHETSSFEVITKIQELLNPQLTFVLVRG